MRSPGINGEGELRGQLANPGSPGKMAFKTVCVHGFGAVKTEIERMIYIAEQLTLSDQQEED